MTEVRNSQRKLRSKEKMYERKAEKLEIIKIIEELIEEGRYKEQVRQRKENDLEDWQKKVREKDGKEKEKREQLGPGEKRKRETDKRRTVGLGQTKKNGKDEKTDKEMR